MVVARWHHRVPGTNRPPLRSSQIARLLQEGAIAPSLFDEKNLAEISSPDFPAERLIACRNPFLAQHRRTKREALLRATEVELQKIVLATKRQKRPLRGKAKIALRVGRLIERFKVAKHFVLEIREEDFAWKRNETKIAEEAALDGMYVVRTPGLANYSGATTSPGAAPTRHRTHNFVCRYDPSRCSRPLRRRESMLAA